MISVDLVSIDNKKVGSVDLNPEVWDTPIKRHLLTEVVNWQRAKRRRGTQSALTKGELTKTTKKAYKQKVTQRH